ncbi:hypothetical protein SAMN05920897_10656 [Alkalispirochaeta americana]|uniref:Outer membrane protein beta-barrel domain-containing protein n=1 Tax=Alkalispirochaeta americana TaxID=159291 RepID=A0A1N6RCN7_9SPIO|nr:hypothetical protein [Alkalispirochaeta americana]SIQ26640.1 hypothetical protein SAMN05920897_10656 [Alkalispirochaeta americana]
MSKDNMNANRESKKIRAGSVPGLSSGGALPGVLMRVLVLVLMLGIFGAAPLWGQADRRAEERSRVDLAGLAEGPAIIGGGIILGEPSGFTAKVWFTETGFAVDAAVAWSFQEDAGLYLHSNALYHLTIIETAGGRYLSPFVGGGLSYRIGSDHRVEVRVPLGLSVLPLEELPLEFFAEIAPGVGIVPDTSPNFGAGIGVRYFLPF